MGKSDERQLPLHEQQGRRSHSGAVCPLALSKLFSTLNFKCAFILLLSVSVFLSAVFWIFPRRSNVSGFDAKDAIKLSSTVQAYFRLEKPVSDLIHNIDRLEYDIYGEIGVPSTKVAVLSMHQADLLNQSDVIFGVLPDPANSSINQLSLDLLKMSFIDLYLQQANLTLTASIFGEPSSFEILKFPNGMTIIPESFSPFWVAPQNLFNFTLHNSIQLIKDNFVTLKEQLKSGLHLKPYEEVFVMVKNNNGSTRDPPVIIEVSAVTDVDILPPERLKQLARLITRSPPSANLGLDNSIFGKVKQISLSSFLSHSLQALPPASAPSPVQNNPEGPPISSIHISPSPSPCPLPNVYEFPPCSDYYSSPPSYTGHLYAPLPGEEHWHSHLPSDITASPVPSQSYEACDQLRILPCGLSPSPASHAPQAAPVFSHYHADSPQTSAAQAVPKMSPSLSPLVAESNDSSGDQEKWDAKSLELSPQTSSASSSSPSVSFLYKEIYTLCLCGFLNVLLRCQLQL